MKRTHVIKSIVRCKVENYGNNVKLVVEMNVKRGCSSFSAILKSNYGDLESLRTVRHSCNDLANCDKNYG